MAIGNDVYADTRLIIAELERRFPSGRLGSSDPAQTGIEHLLRRYITDAGIFMRAAALIPPDMPLLKDPKFQADREQMTGRKWSSESQAKGRPEALVHIRELFDILEETFLADGRKFLLGGDEPMLADVETSFVITWLMSMKVALPNELFSKERYPKVLAWVDRFNKQVKSRSQKPVTLKGDQAKDFIVGGEKAPQNVDETDPTGLKNGDMVTVYPLDSGSRNRDTGKIVTLTAQEVAIEVEKDGKTVVLHTPRWGFRIERATQNPKL